jgi:demethylsterigmatocystin 6-O-methyltransferase
MPAFFRKVGYHDPTDSYHTVFQDAHNTKESCFDWLMRHPANFETFNKYMAARRENQKTWIQVYPVEEDATSLAPERPLFVDIGGNIGHQAAEFKAKYPKLPGKVILQDLPGAIQHALPTPGVENQVHDFYEAQPVKSGSSPECGQIFLKLTIC